MLVRGEGHELRGVDAVAFGERQRLLVWEEEAVREARSDRVAYVALPERAAERWILELTCVLSDLAYGEHAANADDHASRLLRERSALGIEEAERFLWPERAEEGV